MSKDDFDQKKTGRFRTLTPTTPEPGDASAPGERLSSREGSGPSDRASSPEPQPDTSDPLFEKRKTQIFVRAHNGDKDAARDNTGTPGSTDSRRNTGTLPAEEDPVDGDPEDEDLECRTTGQFIRKDMLRD